MKTFKILNNVISFDEGLIDYIGIMQDARIYEANFNDRYMTKPKKNITTLEEFGLYVQELYNNGFAQEYMKLSKELINIYIKYGIYDMSEGLIQAMNTSLVAKHLQKLQPIIEEIEEFSSQIGQELDYIDKKWQSIVEEAVPGNYFNMYSSSYTDLLLNDYFNHKEEKRVEKKRQRLYTENANKTVNDYLSQVMPLCKEYINKIEQLIYEDVIEAIDAMYEKCALDLAGRGKISSFSQYIDSFKANAILDNINKITSREVIEEQIINVLQIDPFNPDAHLQIIEYITDKDIPEYIEIAKFLKLQNVIFNIYFNNYIKGEQKDKKINDRCLYILKAMTDDLDINFLELALNSVCNYSEKFLASIKVTKMYFEALKNILGESNEKVNAKERQFFTKAIKEASKGTNLTYDGSINRLDYDYLCEFWKKAQSQRNHTIKRKEITQNVSNSFIGWIRKHIKLIIIIIIIIAFFNWVSKDSDNTDNTNKEVVDYDTYVQDNFNLNFNKNTQSVEDNKEDTYDIQYDTTYTPGKRNPFAAYEEPAID